MFFLMAAVFAANALRVLPDPKITPGATNPKVTQANIHRTICVPNWTTTVRPSASYTNKLKRMGMNQYGLTGDPHAFEEDHLISIELGGDPTDPRNLWPEPWYANAGGFEEGAHTKDRLENALHKEVCSGEITLEQAQREIATDWIAAYKKHVGELPATKGK